MERKLWMHGQDAQLHLCGPTLPTPGHIKLVHQSAGGALAGAALRKKLSASNRSVIHFVRTLKMCASCPRACKSCAQSKSGRTHRAACCQSTWMSAGMSSCWAAVPLHTQQPRPCHQSEGPTSRTCINVILQALPFERFFGMPTTSPTHSCGATEPSCIRQACAIRKGKERAGLMAGLAHQTKQQCDSSHRCRSC